MAARSSVSARPGGHGLSGVEASAAAHQLAALPMADRLHSSSSLGVVTTPYPLLSCVVNTPSMSKFSRCCPRQEHPHAWRVLKEDR